VAKTAAALNTGRPSALKTRATRGRDVAPLATFCPSLKVMNCAAPVCAGTDTYCMYPPGYDESAWRLFVLLVKFIRMRSVREGPWTTRRNSQWALGASSEIATAVTFSTNARVRPRLGASAVAANGLAVTS